MKRWSTGIAAAALIFVGCNEGVSDKKQIAVGTIRDLTGPVQQPSWEEALNMAFEHANKGLETAKLSYEFNQLAVDSTSNPTLATASGVDFVKNQGAKALIADTSGDDIALNRTHYDADTSNDLNVPILCFSCVSPQINNPNPVNPTDEADKLTKQNPKRWNFRTVMHAFRQAGVLVRLGMAKKPGTCSNQVPGDVNCDGVHKITIYAGREAFGIGFSNAIRDQAKAADPNVVVEQVFHPPTTDATYNWSTDADLLVDNRTRVQNLSTGAVESDTADQYPDVVYDATFPVPSAGITNAYKNIDASLRRPMLHTSGTPFRTTVSKLGDKSNGEEGTTQLFADGASGERFSNDFRAFATKYDGPGWSDAHAYDGAVMAFLGIAAAAKANNLTDWSEVTGEQARDAIQKLADPAGEKVSSGADEFARALGLIEQGKAINYEGASGPMDWSAETTNEGAQNVQNRLGRFVVENGRYVIKETYDCVKDAACPLQ